MPTPSVLIVPNRLKAGILYSQLPANGDVDFSVTRATTAFRTNASGILESVASGVPRLDYTGGGCPALLVEPAATNGILNSQDSSTSWTTGANLSSTLSVVQGVNGRELEVTTAGSDLGSAAGRHRRSLLSFNLVSGSTYTISFIVKRTSTHSIFGYYALATNDLGGAFDVSNLTTGALYSNAAFESRARRITPLGNEEFLCEETFTMTAARTLTAFNVAPVAGVTNTNNPSVNSRIAFAAPQIELGAVATSRIFTVAATATRNADVISKTGVSGFIGQSQGTLYAEVDLRVITATSTPRRPLSIEGATDVNSIIMNIATDGTYQTILGGVSRTNLINTSAVNGVVKWAIAYDGTGFVTFINGTLRDTYVGAYTNPTWSSVGIGGSVNTAGRQLNDRIRAAAIYPTRLTNAELASLTTL